MGTEEFAIVPRKLQHSCGTLRHDGDRELVYRLREHRLRHVDARDVLAHVILGSPLPGLAVDDQLGSGRRGQ